MPGTNFRFGVDALVGLVPGFGDAAGALVSGYIVVEALRMGAPVSVVLRMVRNVAVEVLVGAFPVLGDLFDMTFKANMRNVALLDEHLDDPQAVAKASSRSNRRIGLILIGGLLIVVLAGLSLGVWLVVLLVRWLDATFPAPW